MINIIFKDPEYEINRKNREQWARYNRFIQWGRLHPDRFIELVFGMKLLDYQRLIILGTWTSRFNLWLASRRTGKSQVSAPYLAARAILFPNQTIYMCNRTIEQTRDTFANLERMALKQIEGAVGLTDILYNEVMRGKETETGFYGGQSGGRVEFFNGSTIVVVSSVADNIRGKTANIMFFDEAGFVEDEVYDIAEPTISKNVDFTIGDSNYNSHCVPKKFPNQLILASSASNVNTRFYKHFRTWGTQMLLGDPDYFVFDATCEMGLNHASFHCEPTSPLLTQEVVDAAMRDNEYKAKREYFNSFDDSGGEDSITSFKRIADCEQPYLPDLKCINEDDLEEEYIPIDRDKKQRVLYLFCYDPSNKNDNSVITVFALLRHRDRGLMLKLVYMRNLAKPGEDGKKVVLKKPEQYKQIRHLIADFNGNMLDYENIEKMICDEGSGGGGYEALVAFAEPWTDERGFKKKTLHRGMIQRDHAHLKKDKEFMELHAEAVDILLGANFRADKLAMYDALTEMILQQLIIFPPELNHNGKIRKEVITEGGDIDVVELTPSREQFVALNEISASKIEACSMQKLRSGSSYVITYPANKKRWPDDRVDTLAMGAWYLNKLRRRDNFGERPDRGNLLDVIEQTMKKGKTSNPFTGQKPMEWGRSGKLPW